MNNRGLGTGKLRERVLEVNYSISELSPKWKRHVNKKIIITAKREGRTLNEMKLIKI